MKLRYWLSPRMSAAIALLFVVVGIVLGATSYAASYTGPQNVSNDAGTASLMPHVAQDPQGNVHVVWDTSEGGRKIRWRKGTWNPNTNRYDFGQSVIIADAGDFQYTTPSIGIAPNGTVLAAWSSGFRLYGKTWNMNDVPSGAGVGAFEIMPGFDSNIAVDSNNHFHIVANGDFQVQYCELAGAQCVRRDSFSLNQNATPDVAVDKSNGVHVVMSGGGARYRYRAAGQNWGNIELLGGGNVPSVAADYKGNVHIVWSKDYNIQYCRKASTPPATGCLESFGASAASDLSPSVGATRGGNVMFAFYDADFKKLWTNTRENGAAWAPSRESGDAPTRPDVTALSFTNRISAVWSVNYDISILTVVLATNDCDNDTGISQRFAALVSPDAIPRNGLYLPVTFGGPLPVAGC